MANLRIEDYALIGDCATAALVGRNGSIDWLCLPRFDSPACFAALLGEPEHGRWLIAPSDPDHRVERRYLDGSLVLATTFDAASISEMSAVRNSAESREGGRTSQQWLPLFRAVARAGIRRFQ
jgi:GH15 family glucan-1,4-alpha-glucosidase